MDFETDFKKLLIDSLTETGLSLRAGLDSVAQYAAARATYLATLVGQPGFELAVRAERDSVAIFAGLVATQEARAADARVIGVIQGALLFGAKALAVAAT